MALPLILGLMAGGALLGAAKGKKNEKLMEAQNKYRQAVIKYSPWTNMTDPGSMNLPDAQDSLLQGALTGASLGSAFGGAGAAAAPAGGATAAAAPMTTSGVDANILQQQQMGNQKYLLLDPNQQQKMYS